MRNVVDKDGYHLLLKGRPVNEIQPNPANPRLRQPVAALLEALMQQTLQRGGSPSVAEIAEARAVVEQVRAILDKAIFETPEQHAEAQRLIAKL